jgi:hypothetical protein
VNNRTSLLVFFIVAMVGLTMVSDRSVSIAREKSASNLQEEWGPWQGTDDSSIDVRFQQKKAYGKSSDWYWEFRNRYNSAVSIAYVIHARAGSLWLYQVIVLPKNWTAV